MVKLKTNEEKMRIGETAKMIGVSKQTLKNWDKLNVFKPDITLPNSGHRYYTLAHVKNYINNVLKKI